MESHPIARVICMIIALAVLVAALISIPTSCQGNTNKPIPAAVDIPKVIPHSSSAAPSSETANSTVRTLTVRSGLPVPIASAISVAATKLDTGLPRVTNGSYWRLVRQGRAEVLPATEESLRLMTRERSYDIANYPELDLADESIKPMGTFGVYAETAVPGTILSRIQAPGCEFIISVPELTGELAEFAKDRGESWVLIYSKHRLGGDQYKEKAVLTFFHEYGSIAYHVIKGEYTSTYVSMVHFEQPTIYETTSLRDTQTPGQVDIIGAEFPETKDGLSRMQQTILGALSPDFPAGGTRHTVTLPSQDLAYQYYEYPHNLLVTAHTANFSETTFIPSPIQTALLIDAVTEGESHRLADRYLK